MYGSLDASPRTGAEERTGKLFVRFLKSTPGFANRQVDFQRWKKEIVIDWRLVAKVSCPSRDKRELLFRREGLSQCNLTPAALLALFNLAMGDAGTGPGSSQVRWESCV